jgi:hypothetical protein
LRGLDSIKMQIPATHLMPAQGSTAMDAVMLAIGFVFFALSIVYVYACDQL